MEQKLLNRLLGAFDSFTKFHTVIQADHNYIHQGLAHTAIVEVGSISSAYYIGFTTPTVESGIDIHWRPSGIQSSANYLTYKLYEGDAFTNDSAITIENRNRIADATMPSVMQSFSKGVTSTPTGSLIELKGIGTSGNPSSRAGGGAGSEEELLLAPNTNYVIGLTPAGATVVTAEFFWYEELAE